MFDFRRLRKFLSQPDSWGWEPDEIVDEFGETTPSGRYHAVQIQL